MKNETYIKTENGLELISSVEVNYTLEQLNQMQYDELCLTDWYFIRKLDNGTEIPLNIIEERNNIREKYKNLKLQINK